MTLNLIFWILLLFGLFWLVLGPKFSAPWAPLGNNVLLFVLLALLGWRVFGAAIQG